LEKTIKNVGPAWLWQGGGVVWPVEPMVFYTGAGLDWVTGIRRFPFVLGWDNMFDAFNDGYGPVIAFLSKNVFYHDPFAA
jgi:hypothetical protein